MRPPFRGVRWTLPAVLCGFFWVFNSSTVLAAETTLIDEIRSVDVHGFVSQGFLYSTRNNYLAESRRGSFEFTEVGINFNKQVTERLRFGAQLFSRDLGPIGNYAARFDWFHLDYRFADWLGFRAGRVKLPFGLYNESSDIDAARVPILLPQSLYPTSNRDFLLAQTGVEVYGYRALGKAGALDYRLFAGTIFVDLPRANPGPVHLASITNPYLYGARLLWETPLDGLRVGASAERLELRSDVILNGTVPLELRLPALLWAVSGEYAWQDLLVSAEYSRWHQRLFGSDPTLLAPTAALNERAYLMVSYRVARWLVPGAYYSLIFRDAHHRGDKPAGEQHDIAATLRFDINQYWLIKLEGHYMKGTALLDPQLNGGVPLASLPPRWWLFLAKTTLTF